MARRAGRPKEGRRRVEEAERGRGSRVEKAGSGRTQDDFTRDDNPSTDAGEAGADRTENSRLGRLVVLATPIGNLGDLSPRGLEALRSADVIVSEDTSVGARLLAAHDLRRSVLRLDEHAPAAKIRSVLEHALKGKTVLYFSDAGTPGVSDPGPALVDKAYELGIEVDALPGPAAAMTALMLSGYFAQRFVFLGFLPRKPGAMKSEFLPYADSTTTLVFFESPLRLAKTLKAALDALGDRRVSICREMTKKHQQVVRGKLSELISDHMTFKGECTIVLEGRRRNVAEGA